MDERRLNSVEGYEFTALSATFIEVLNGCGSITIDGKRYEVNGHCMIGYFSGQHIVSNVKKSLQRGVMFSDNFMDGLYLGAVKYHDLRNAFISPFNDVFRSVNPEYGTSRSPLISGRFLVMLQDNYKNRYELGYYADRLNISTRYLYSSVVASTGKSPKQWINQTLMSESKRLLEDPDISILQVSQILHFATLQSFGKFFRVQTGMSPRDYRSQIKSA